MQHEITDEMVEQAIAAIAIHSTTYMQMRAALGAVAPLIRAQGMGEAAEIAAARKEDFTDDCDWVSGWRTAFDRMEDSLLARAAELEKAIP